MSTISKHSAPPIVTDWRRFAIGLWRLPKGDISLAYSGNTLPNVATFVEAGRLFTMMGMSGSGAFYSEASCFPLIPGNDYHGPEPRKYGYEGRAVQYKGQPFRLGPQRVFCSSPLAVDECRRLLRVLYADGGLFACQPSYDQFLIELRATFTTPEAREAHRLESHGELLEFTKHEMVSFLAQKPAPHPQQLEFGLLSEPADTAAPLFASPHPQRLDKR